MPSPLTLSDVFCSGRELGATDVIPERGDERVEGVRELTGGDGTHAVLECDGTSDAITMAITATRDGGTVGRVGAPQYSDVPMDLSTVMRNITLTGSGRARLRLHRRAAARRVRGTHRARARCSTDQ
jgi:threonine dehydrogenase-like Zn-dependent dehydrogenase